MKKKIAIIGGLGFSGIETALAKAAGHEVEIVHIDDVKDRLKEEAEKKYQPPKLTALQEAYAFADGQRQKRLKKDKTHLKRYSSYFNKKKQ